MMMRTFLVLALAAQITTSSYARVDAEVRPSVEPASSTVLVDSYPTIKIDCDNANIRIVSWLSDKVTVVSTGSTGELLKLDSSNTVVFHHKDAQRGVSQDMFPAVHTIFVPANATVEMFVANGNVTISGSLAALDVSVDRGNVTVWNGAGIRAVETAQGVVQYLKTGEPISEFH